jgi:MFS family permease
MLAYVFSFVDRQILSLLIEPIKADLALTDTQFGLLHGFAFALFYATMGIPIAQLSDRYSRPAIIAAGVCLWSVATAICGLARTFGQLFTARMAVGIGEGALSPATYSLLADYFPREELGRAVAVYSTGSFIGAGLAYLGGGAVVALVSRNDALALPLVGQLQAWQLTFIGVGLPGVIVAALCWLTVREVPRREAIAASGLDAPLSLGASDGLIAFCRSHAATLGWHFAGFSFASLSLYQLLGWSPAILMRTFNFSAPGAGYALGIATLIASTAGVLTSGWLNDAFWRRGRTDAPMLVGAIGGAGVVLPLAVLPLVTSAAAAVGLLGVALFFAAFPMPPSTTAIQLLAPNRMRSRVAAMFLFCNSLFGMAAGSVAVGALNDYVLGGPAAVTISVALVAGGGGVGAALCLLAGRRSFRESLKRSSRSAPGAGQPVVAATGG